MQVRLTSRKIKCNGEQECEENAVFNIKFKKYSINLCKNCAYKLYQDLAVGYVPKSIKSKFLITKS